LTSAEAVSLLSQALPDDKIPVAETKHLQVFWLQALSSFPTVRESPSTARYETELIQ